ncbi:hypothetical protein HDU98_005070 [Podochytrium sp. JEL0797]|nr:hypothetical protein HDU98_005070 [Podochytrium sp. JEL0797]
MSLSQDDFRKLLATPRHPTQGGSSESKFAKPLPKKKSDFARPVPAKLRKKHDPAAQDPDDPEDPNSRFRDRAKERRLGVNPDYKDSEQIIASMAQAEQLETDEDAAKLQYEQSKFLGGDVEHTHLVKGLDFVLLKKLKSELKQPTTNNDEENADAFLDRIETTSLHSTLPFSATPTTEDNTTTFLSPFAERIHTAALQTNRKKALPKQNDLFRAGLMAFCWDVRNGEDMPTTIVRSKADLKDEMKSATADSEIVIGKIAEILASVRFGTRTKEGLTAGEKKLLKKKEIEEQQRIQKEAEAKLQKAEDMMEDDGDDIFADVGRDYSLEVVDKSTGERVKATAAPTLSKPGGTASFKSTTYFAKPVLDSDDSDSDRDAKHPTTAPSGMNEDDDDDMFADLEPSTTTTSTAPPTSTNPLSSLLTTSAAMLNQLQGAGTAEKMLTEERHAQAKTHKGLSLSRLTNNYGEEDAEFDQYYDSDDADEEEEAAADTAQLDLGIKARKKSQMKRYDFDTEEEFQKYKDSQVVMPKSAYQFGIKSSEGRKNRNELKGGKGGKQGEEKELKQLEKILGEKYGMSMNDDKKREGSGKGGPAAKKTRIMK